MAEELNTDGIRKPRPENTARPSRIPTRQGCPEPDMREIRKNGLYYYALSPLQRQFYAAGRARAPGDVGPEIDLMSNLVRSMLTGAPQDRRYLVPALKRLAGLVKLQRSFKGARTEPPERMP